MAPTFKKGKGKKLLNKKGHPNSVKYPTYPGDSVRVRCSKIKPDMFMVQLTRCKPAPWLRGGATRAKDKTAMCVSINNMLYSSSKVLRYALIRECRSSCLPTNTSTDGGGDRR